MLVGWYGCVLLPTATRLVGRINVNGIGMPDSGANRLSSERLRDASYGTL
jgi:hypothetical protein